MTAKKFAGEEKIEDSQFDLRLFINSVVDYAIIGLDIDGNISTWNAGAERLKGYTEQEIIGHHFSSFYTPEDQASGLPQRLLQQAKELGHTEHTGWRVRKDGTRFWGNVVISAVKDKTGTLIGYAKVTRDLTERKLAEERERKLASELEFANEMKSQFLANMSHEVRTPLNGIIGMLAILRESDLNSEQHELAETAHRSSHALLRIVNDILDFSKVEAGHMELENAPFAINEVLREVFELFSPQARSKSIRLQLMKDDSLPPIVLGDSGRLRQVLANLVGNAVKFTNAGSVVISASLEESDDKTATVFFEITDTGIGIESGQKDRLFEAFSQADVSTTRQFGGTGLGLPISQHLVKLMGGNLTVENQNGGGSKFSFVIKFSGVERKTLPARQPENRLGSIDVTDAAPHILIAEDNVVNQQVASLIVRRLGYRTTVVANGQQAVERLTHEHFDAVLMDCQMPVLDGFQATEQIRALDGPNAKIPIIAVTASAMPNERKHCFSVGMNDFIPKPIFPNDLKAALERFLGTSTANQNVDIRKPNTSSH